MRAAAGELSLEALPVEIRVRGIALRDDDVLPSGQRMPKAGRSSAPLCQAGAWKSVIWYRISQSSASV